MSDHCEVIPLRPESRTEKVQSKYVSRDQFQKCREYRDFGTNSSKNSEKKLENGLSESRTGHRLRTTDFCLGARFLRFCTLYLEHGIFITVVYGPYNRAYGEHFLAEIISELSITVLEKKK